jgi:hypothetical protein
LQNGLAWPPKVDIAPARLWLLKWFIRTVRREFKKKRNSAAAEAQYILFLSSRLQGLPQIITYSC